MSVTAINSSLLKTMITNGAINLKNQHKEIDALNVFPVPDGDTGTNMQMTMMSGVNEMNNCKTDSVVDLSKSLSRGLLMGARGNSGVILSQFFRGLYVKMKQLNKAELSLDDFVECLVSGYEVSYKAVMEPVEGTILTVVRESAEYLQSVATLESLEDLLEKYINQAKKSLANTPNLLPVLKEAGVVDSGGAGFVKVIEGMLMAVRGELLQVAEPVQTLTGAQSTIDAEIKYGYCTEFIVEMKEPEKFSEEKLRNTLLDMGDSLVLVTDENILKVHVHVNFPEKVLEIAHSYGEFVKIKVENMRLQHSQIIEEAQTNKEEPVKKQEHKKYGLIAVCFGEGIKRTFKDLGVDYIIDGGQTMNPSTESFVNAVNAVNADNVIIIPNNSNVILAAEQAVKLCENKAISVLKAKTIAQGYASLMSFDSTVSIEENAENMTESIKACVSGEVTYAVRDTEINGIKITSGDYMGIKNGEIVISTTSRLDAIKQLIEKSLFDDASIVTIFTGKDLEEAEIEEVVSYAEGLNNGLEVEVIQGDQEIYSYIISVE